MDAKSVAGNISSVMHADDDMITAHWHPTSVVRLWSFIHLLKARGEYQQWWIAAAPRHPAIRYVMNATVARIRNHKETRDAHLKCTWYRNMFGKSLALYLVSECKGLDILQTTGPFVFTRGIDEYMYEHMHNSTSRRVRVLWPNGDGVFTYDFHGNHREHSRHYSLIGDPLVVDAKSGHGKKKD